MIVQVDGPGERLEQVRALFLEYARSLDFSLCFQGFDDELRELPGMYAPPGGRLLLAIEDGEPAGCVGVHGLAPDVGEMKRLYVRPRWRRTGLGRVLAQRACDEARAIGYRKIRLDTVAATMQSAIALYRAMGFREIPAYRENPLASALYLEKLLW
jgi:carbonic anhydrase